MLILSQQNRLIIDEILLKILFQNKQKNNQYPLTLFFKILTQWCWDKILQTTFSKAVSWMKMQKFRLKFQWIFFLRTQLTIFWRWFKQWLGAQEATSHYLNQRWSDYWCIYASLSLNEFKSISIHPSFWVWIQCSAAIQLLHILRSNVCNANCSKYDWFVL